MVYKYFFISSLYLKNSDNTKSLHITSLCYNLYNLKIGASMRLTFLGAAREVTGSCYFLEINSTKILIDCGMEQGPDLYDNQELAVPANEVDFVLLTHAHIDHSGLLPLLYRNGFRGQIFTTHASKDLCHIMLLDSAHIQEMEAEWRNKKINKNSASYYTPMYSEEDVLGVEKHFSPCDYNKKIPISENINAVFYDAGHLLGSASIEIEAIEDGISKKIVFSGDIGNKNKPIIKNPTLLKDADYVVMESTYGNQKHRETNNYKEQLIRILKRTFARNGNVVIPSFAVGRMQELLYFLRLVKSDPQISPYKNFKVYVDSPLAIEATTIFKNSNKEYFDEETQNLIANRINPLEFKNLKMSLTSDDSKQIMTDTGHKVIIAASGMCEAGRIRHHLKSNLPGINNTIVFVGFQVPGTLGRTILDGAKSVKIFNEEVPINSEICEMKGTSSHADMDDLYEWAKSFYPKPVRIFVTHGNEDVAEEFAENLSNGQGLSAIAPYNGAIWNLSSNECIFEGNKGIKRRTDRKRPKGIYRINGVYGKLLDSIENLNDVVKKNEGLENRELRKLIDEIDALAKKWDRDL